MNIESYNKVKISYPKDCGNAPKKIILVNFYIAVANNDDKYIYDNTSNKLAWEIIGQRVVDDRGEEIQIRNVITHGNVCAVNGSISFIDESRFDFCDVFKFDGFGKKAKVKEVSSYVIRTE
jgi:hypothetical protein